MYGCICDCQGIFEINYRYGRIQYKVLFLCWYRYYLENLQAVAAAFLPTLAIKCTFNSTSELLRVFSIKFYGNQFDFFKLWFTNYQINKSSIIFRNFDFIKNSNYFIIEANKMKKKIVYQQSSKVLTCRI